MRTKLSRNKKQPTNEKSFFGKKTSNGFFSFQTKLNEVQKVDNSEDTSFASFLSPSYQNGKHLNTNDINTPVIQKQEAEEEELQTKSDLQFQAEEEEEMVQTKAEDSAKNIHGIAKKGFLGSAGSYPFFNQIQASFGRYDISNIKSYNDSNARKANQKIGSLAYAAGSKVAFRNSPTLHTAAHEAAHVVQQRNGVNLKSGIGQKNDSYERHADSVADRVVQGKSAENLLSNTPVSMNQSPVNALQFNIERASSWLGEFWDAHVYPAHQPGTSSGNREVGRQVRSFQRLHNRRVTEEGGQQIIEVNDSGITGGQTLSDSEQISQPGESGPRQWNLDLTTHELFDPQPELSDVIQNSIGDCYLLATLQGMASRGGGRTQLQNAVSESGNGYSVEFFRIQIIGNQALVDPNSRIRVSLGRQHNPQGVQLREKAGSMTDSQAREVIQNSQYSDQLQAGDSFNVNWTKRIIWPWAIERAYASVAGGFGRIEGGFSALPMMALSGEIPYHIYSLSSYNSAQLALVLSRLNTLSDNDTIVTSWTYDTLPTIYSRNFVVEETHLRNGMKLRGSDGVVTDWIPWREIMRYVSSFIILDPFGPLNGRPAITTQADHTNWAQAIFDASSLPGVLISGNLSTICLGQGLLLAPAHIYSITSLSSAGAQTSNPWSYLHPGLVTPAQLQRAFGRITFKP